MNCGSVCVSVGGGRHGWRHVPTSRATNNIPTKAVPQGEKVTSTPRHVFLLWGGDPGVAGRGRCARAGPKIGRAPGGSEREERRDATEIDPRPYKPRVSTHRVEPAELASARPVAMQLARRGRNRSARSLLFASTHHPPRHRRANNEICRVNTNAHGMSVSVCVRGGRSAWLAPCADQQGS